jgi:uncharacterized Tic20 family protein/DNA-binding XRE family transcriptional regulator
MNQLGSKITQARKNKGLSQEKLADDAKINLRTLQRIEKGDTYPHGDTLLRISKSLEIPLEDFVDYGFEENYGYIKAMHFVTLVFLLLPLGNILLPLIFWLTRKDQIKDISFFAKKLLNFQITWSLITYLPFVTVFINFFFHVRIPAPAFLHLNSVFIIFMIPMILYFINFIYIIVVGLAIKDRCRNFFPIAIRFIR